MTKADRKKIRGCRRRWNNMYRKANAVQRSIARLEGGRFITRGEAHGKAGKGKRWWQFPDWAPYSFE